MEVSGMYYIKEQAVLVLSSEEDKRLCAMRSSDGHIIWDTSTQQINSKMCTPDGLVYLSQVDLVLVGDWKNRRAIAVAAGSGDVIQTIGLKEVGDNIDEFHVRDGQLIVRHHGGRSRARLSTFSVCNSFCYPYHRTTKSNCAV